MAQFKIYGRRDALEAVRSQMSDVVHRAAVDVLELPQDKRFQRFFPMSAEDFPSPPGRTERYTIIEILMFEGRSVATKKALYARLFRDFAEQLSIESHDLEITVLETPRHDWAIRGRPGDELVLSYQVDQ